MPTPTPTPTGRRQHPYVDLDKKIALFMFGATLALFAFWLYGWHSPTTEIIRNSTPLHIYHQNYYDSGTS